MTTPDEKTFATLTKLFEEEFGPIGDRQVLYVHAPGRSEISGNHTDHEGGHVIAGSLDVAVDGIAVATDTNKIRVADEGYPTFEITLDTLDIQASEKGTSASLVRGMAHEIAALGVEPQGFDFAFTCSVPSGGGLSSSAAVEAAYGRAMETLWGAPAIEPVALAQMSQRTENNYYGKPCGLMDQAAVCLGGLAYMDFEDQAQPKTQKLELNFEDHGYALVLVKVVPTTWPPPTTTPPFRAKCRTSPPSLARNACARSMLPTLTPSSPSCAPSWATAPVCAPFTTGTKTAWSTSAGLP